MKIYLAGGWFTPEQEEEHTRIAKELNERTDYVIYNPRLEGEIGSSTSNDKMSVILLNNVMNIAQADKVVVIYDGKDTGTIWEAGFAYALHKPIIYYAEKPATKVNLMLAKTGEFVSNVDDLICTLAADLPFKDICDSFEGEIE